MALTANIDLNVTGKHTGVLDLGTAVYPFALSTPVAFASGTGTGQADRVFTDTRTLAGSATESLDLAGTLTDAFGATITFVTIKAVIVRAAAANNIANQVQVTRPASNGVAIFMAAGDGISLAPGYAFAWFGSGTGVTVTPATGDLLTITNSAGTNSVNYDIVVIGTSA
jgi:hypothetical protein